MMARTATDLAVLFGVFALGTAIAEAAGAANLGTALSFGVIAFALTLLWILLRE